MKRYILMAISLMLTAFSVFSLIEDKEYVIAGPGNGENAEITDVEDFEALLAFIGNTDGTSYAAIDDGSSTKISVGDDEEDEEEEKKLRKFESVTIYNDTFEDATFMSTIITGVDHQTGQYITETIGCSKVNINRSLTIYITEDASYYVSKGSISSKYDHYKDNDNDYELFIQFDFQMYLTDDDCYIKFNSFYVREDGEEIADISEVAGKWIKVDDDSAVDMFISMDVLNRGTLSSIGDYISDGMEGFRQYGSKYTLTTSMVGEDDTEVVFDFTDSTMPFVSIIAKGSEDGSSIDLIEKLTFANIDNTIIEVDFGHVEKYDAEDFERMFGGEG